MATLPKSLHPTAQEFYLFPSPTGSYILWWITATSTGSQWWTSTSFQELMRCLTGLEMQVTSPNQAFIKAFIRFGYFFPNTSNAQHSGPSTALLRTRSCHSDCAMPLGHFKRQWTIFSRTCVSSLEFTPTTS